MFGPLTPVFDSMRKPLRTLKKPLLIRHYGNAPIKKAGSAPGTLVHTGEQLVQNVVINVLDYSERTINEKNISSVKDTTPFKKTSTVTWINVTGLHDTQLIEELGKIFDLHPLLLEDIVNVNQRPKFEDFDDYIFIVAKMLVFDAESKSINSEQVSLVLGKNFVISFQEKPGDVFDPIRQRIRTSKGKFRKAGADYLVYALLDSMVDNYFTILEKIGENIEDLEELLALEPKPEYLPLLHSMKREMIFLRKSVWPLREVANSFVRAESPLVQDGTGIYLRDVYDHTIQVIDTIDTFRDMLSGMLDLYLSGLSNKMNEIMKVLTLFAAIFIPLTFVAGIYGMNFQNMPELNWQYGYFYALGIMIFLSGTMLFFFKKHKWI